MEFFPNYTFLLDKRENYAYNIYAFGVWRSLVSRLVRDQEASGSNPDTPTTKETSFVYQDKGGFSCTHPPLNNRNSYRGRFLCSLE